MVICGVFFSTRTTDIKINCGLRYLRAPKVALLS
jgi:hypothetical protein